MDSNYRNPNAEIRCFQCGDKNIQAEDESKSRSKIDYYAGSPAFKKEEKRDKDLDWRFD